MGGCTFSIRPGAAPYGHLIVEELDTLEQARSQFETLKRGMLAASLNVGCGIRVNDDLRVIDDDATALPSERDQPFVCRQERNQARLMISLGEPIFQLQRVLSDVIQGLEVGISSSFAVEALCDKLVALACKLYADSFFERSSEARFITLIGALEVLKDKDSVSTETEQLVEGWLRDVKLSKIPEPELKSLRGQLNRMKQLSIGRGIGGVVGRHLGDDRAREVQILYGIRSTLVHEGKPPDDLEGCLGRTQLVVRELLIRILWSGSR
jgi:hypothetical protein